MPWVAGALMFGVVRDNLRVIVRLAALLVLLGLGAVPVECGAVYGPHSVFVSAEAVAALRASATEVGIQAGPAAHVHTERSSASDALEMESAADASAPSAPDTRQGASAGARATVPTTAGAMTEALIAVALFTAPVGIAGGVPAPLPLPTAQPVNHLLPAPEPPPP